jgi:ParB family chromosome partitioning protein
MEKKSDRRGLGRGLSALMADINLTHDDQNLAAIKRPDLMVAVEDIAPNPHQPRRHFDPSSLKELAGGPTCAAALGSRCAARVFGCRSS